ncbi:MAG: hypothetical protein IJ104_10165 [Methanobrevibacter sp.]|nr:hypothetical protein [Methanobrevibacter sp.]
MKLTVSKLKEEAIAFCKNESNTTHEDLIGVTDGKAVGTYIEHEFEKYLKNKYEVTIGSSARGIDLPDLHINTDIKVTSVKKPQSSSPFKNIEQKIYGLGHNLLIFVYEKTDINDKCYLDFKHCIFIDAEKTGDYNLTKILRKLIKLNADKEDIIDILKDSNVPGDDPALEILAEKIIKNPPEQGYLTISNAFQWRLKYNNVINLDEDVDGVHTYEKFNKKELRNYQTPIYITDEICGYLKNDLKINPEVIIEPFCRIGNFLKSASDTFPESKLIGIDIDKKNLNEVDSTIPNITLINEDIFSLKFENINNDSYLILGNPIGVTNSELSKISLNQSNFKNKTDFEALSRNSNIDISEYVILKIINEFKDTNTTIAFLCKTTISRNVFIELIENEIPYSFIKQINFNSHKAFKIDADACLFVIQFGGKPLTDKTCAVADISNPSEAIYKFGFKSDKFYSNIDDIPDLEGECQIEWRQGVKHDCAKVMELMYEDKHLINKNNEDVNIEDTLVYPLLKGSKLKKPIITETSMFTIITQKKIKQDTTYIENEAPKTWKYLNDNKDFFDNRKSSIYEKAPDFSIFGIGDYSFKKYKVAISGFYKNPIFSLVYSEKTMMLDDTCYFLSFDDYDLAYITMLILNSRLVRKFLKNIAFIDSKRPFAKKVLKRVDINKCLKLLSFSDLEETESELELDTYLTKEKLRKYEELFS